MKCSLTIGVLLMMAFTAPGKKITVWLVGDSTMSVKEVKTYPETGWGMPFAGFFDSTVLVDNRAKNGRSTKSFMAEGLWEDVKLHLKEGDYVLIQFGHNDEGKEKVGRYTTPEEFAGNLAKYVSETREKKAIPVLITPAARRQFDSSGNVKESHPLYSDVVKAVAQKLNVPLVDLNAESKHVLQELGPVNSALLYNHLEPGEHPNYPDGKKDDTHFSELGARKMAEIVLAAIKELDIPLAAHIYKPTEKK